MPLACAARMTKSTLLPCFVEGTYREANTWKLCIVNRYSLHAQASVKFCLLSLPSNTPFHYFSVERQNTWRWSYVYGYNCCVCIYHNLFQMYSNTYSEGYRRIGLKTVFVVNVLFIACQNVMGLLYIRNKNHTKH